MPAPHGLPCDNLRGSAKQSPNTVGQYCGRFAPTPSGPLHLGSMFTALASFLQARSNQGQWLLRIDDIDTPRVAAGAADDIKRTLERHALYWDQTEFLQSQGTEAYEQALQQLDANGRLYPCSCSRKDLASLHRNNSEPAVYPGTCRNANRSRKQPHALRMCTENVAVKACDLLQGPQHWDIERECGDFIVLRRDGIVSYHLATVIDDWLSGVSEVLRGVDLLESTPLQIHLQRLLGLTSPSYLHVPVIANRQGIKLSKQNLAEAVDDSNPSITLVQLLTLLKQRPPEELHSAPPEEILAWAVQNWDVSKLAGVRMIETP